MEYDEPYIDEDGMYYEDELYGREYYDEDDPAAYGYYDQYYEEDSDGQQQYEYVAISSHELLMTCVLPTLGQTMWMVFPLLILCLVQRLTWSLFWQDHEVELAAKKSGNTADIPADTLQPWVVHTSSVIWGVVACHFFFEMNLLYLAALVIVLYPMFILSYVSKRCGIIVAFTTVTFLLSCELFVVSEENWHRIRGAQIILAMKAISLGFDIDSGAVKSLPSVFEFGGYMFHVGTIIFGPWVSFSDYLDLLKPHGKKVGKAWVICMVKSLLLSVTCVIISNCIVPWLYMTTSYRWVAAYRDAQSFRFSHYFIGYLSQVTAVLTGLGSRKQNGVNSWQLDVTRVYYIEVPRSLVEVVTNWNLPMHFWLKTYVFKTAKPMGSFVAVILTYVASSLLHGLNFQLAAVLLSLGFYSYTEYVLRRRLSVIFNACIKAKPCCDCNHQYTKWHPGVVCTNMGFFLLSVFHLSYLGLMFDSSQEEEKGYTMAHTLSKWSVLSYASHWVALGSYVFYLLI